MNTSSPEIQTYLNASQGTSYKVDGSTKSCVLIIGPLIKLLQEFIYNSIVQSGSFVMDGWRAHYDFHDPAVIKEGFQITLSHMALGYAFIAASLVALILLPITCCMKFCSKSSINLYKYQICFCMEGFIFILACVAVFLSAASSIQTVVHVDEALQSHPELARNIIDDLTTYQNNIQVQLIHLKHDLDKVLDFVLNTITDFPDKATSIAEQSTSALMFVTTTTFTQIHDKFQATCKETDFENCDNPERKFKLVNELENVGTVVNDARRRLEDLRQRVVVDVNIDESERELLASNIFSVHNASILSFDAENMLSWTLLYKEIYDVLDDLPKANKSLHFLKNMTKQISSFLQPIRKNWTSQSVKLKSWSNSSLIDFTSLCEKILPNATLQRIKNQTYQTDQILTYLDITSETNFAVFSGRAFLVLAPGLHGLILLLILSVACIYGVHEISRLNRTGSESALPKNHPSYGAKILYCGTLFGLSLLWWNFLVAGLSYLSAIVLSMVCQPVVDTTIFKRYIDDTQVWNGYTWIDTHMKEYVNNYHEHIKMEAVLGYCALNQTVYNAFGMAKFWNITEKLNIDNVKINETEFQLAIKRGITSTSMPNASLTEKISTKINHISQILDMVFGPKFAAEMKTLEDINTTRTYIQTLTRRLQNDSKYSYIEETLQQVLNSTSLIESYNITRSIAKLAVLKRSIGELKIKVLAVAFDLLEMNSTVYETVMPQVHNHVNLSIATANNTTLSYARRTEMKLRTEVGNCHLIYKLYRKTKWAICDNGLTLVNAVWTSHGMMAITMAVLLVLCCRISSYLRGAYRAQIHWQQRLQLRRHERRLATSQALGFGDVGNDVLLPKK